MLFGQHQPYGDALNVPCDIVLELIESRLDEGLSTLKGDGPRLARKKIAVTKSHGSVKDFVADQLKKEVTQPSDIL